MSAATPVAVDHDEGIEINRRLWDERAAAHEQSELYDLDGFVQGGSQLRPWESDEVGPVEDLDLLHLQCHIGTDTLSWARLGARVTGLDFSTTSIDVAARLAERCGLDAEWIVSDVYGALDAVDGRRWDIVYTGIGALGWLPDIDRWAEVVAGLLRPGGFLYLLEIHPMASAVRSDGQTIGEHVFADDFHRWPGEPDDGSYAAPDATFENNDSCERLHSLSEIVRALISAGLVIDDLNEFDVTNVPTPWLIKGEDGLFRFPEDAFRFPLLYSLRARKPE